MSSMRKDVLEHPKTIPHGRRKIGKGYESVKDQNQRTILTMLSRAPLTFSELKKEMGFTDMGIARHLRELEELGYVRKTRIGKKRVYEIQDIPNIEELIVEALMNHLGHLIAFRLLEASVRREKKVHIEEFFDVEGFLGNFLEKNFPRFRDTGMKALLERLKEKYGEPTL